MKKLSSVPTVTFICTLTAALRQKLYPNGGADRRTLRDEFYHFGLIALNDGEGDWAHFGVGRKTVLGKAHLFEIASHLLETFGRDLVFVHLVGGNLLEQLLQSFGIGKGLLEHFKTTKVGHACIGFGLRGVEGVDLRFVFGHTAGKGFRRNRVAKMGG